MKCERRKYNGKIDTTLTELPDCFRRAEVRLWTKVEPDVLVVAVPRCGSTRQLRDSRGDTRWSRSCSSPRPPPSLSPCPRREHSREILAAQPAEAAQVREHWSGRDTVTCNCEYSEYVLCRYLRNWRRLLYKQRLGFHPVNICETIWGKKEMRS